MNPSNKEKINTSLIDIHLKNRKILCSLPEDYQIPFIEDKLQISGYIDFTNHHHYNDTDDKPVYSITSLKNRKDDFYILIPSKGDINIEQLLIDLEYHPIIDYLFLYQQEIYISLNQSKNYYDIYGNKIIGNVNGCQIIFKGINNKVIIHKNFICGTNCSIILYNNCELIIDENFIMGNHNQFIFYDNSYFQLGKNCTFANYIKIRSSGAISIGDSFKMEDNGIITNYGQININHNIFFQQHCLLFSSKYAVVNIQNFSMFSWYTKIIAGEGHSIFDLKHKIKMNSITSKEINIGSHVWGGANATFLNPSQVGDNCIISANSIVSKSHPDNSLVSGTPARTVLENISWDIRENMTYNEYINTNETETIDTNRIHILDEFNR